MGQDNALKNYMGNYLEMKKKRITKVQQLLNSLNEAHRV
jgi:hypothetical protein